MYQSLFMPELQKELEGTRKVQKVIETQNTQTLEDIQWTQNENEKLRQTIARHKMLIDAKLSAKKQKREASKGPNEAIHIYDLTDSEDDLMVEFIDKQGGRAYQNMNVSMESQESIGSAQNLYPNNADKYIKSRFFKDIFKVLSIAIHKNVNNYEHRGFEFASLLLFEAVSQEFKKQLQSEMVHCIVIDEFLNKTYIDRHKIQ